MPSQKNIVRQQIIENLLPI